MVDQEPETADRMGLWEYLVVLRRRWRMVAATLVATMVMALGYSLWATPEYLTSADILLGPTDADLATTVGSSSRSSSDEIATQAHVVTSLPVARLVQQRWKLDQMPDLTRLVSVQAVGTGRILRVTVRDSDGARAAETANTVATAYLQFRQQDSLENYQQALDRLSKRQTDLREQLRRVEALLASGKKGAGGRLSLQSQRRSLLADLTQIGAQQDSLRDSIAGVSSGGVLLRDADVPGTPESPRTRLNLVLAGVLGLFLGAGLALLRDRFDDGVHDEAEARRALGHPVVLGRPPLRAGPAPRTLVCLEEPRATASQEYQRLAANVRLMLAPARPGQGHGAVVLLTGAQRAEGAGVTAANLAVAATGLGLRVVLVDADLCGAEIDEWFERAVSEPGDLSALAAAPGLAELLAGTESFETFLHDVGVGDLRVLPAGSAPPNPAALLGSPRMRMLLQDLVRTVDLVILAGPPLLVGADALEIAGRADLALVVTRERVSRRRQLALAAESLRHASVSVIGMVYNRAAGRGGARAAGRRFAVDRRRRVRDPESVVQQGEETAVRHPGATNGHQHPAASARPGTVAADGSGVRGGRGDPVPAGPAE